MNLKIPSWIHLLHFLRKNEDSKTLKEISEMFSKNLTYPRVAKIINLLEKDGFVIKKRIGKEKIVKLTKKGKEASELYGKLFCGEPCS